MITQDESIKLEMGQINVTEGVTVHLCLLEGGVKAYFSHIHEEPSATKNEYRLEFRYNGSYSAGLREDCRELYLNFSGKTHNDDNDFLGKVYSTIEGTERKTNLKVQYVEGKPLTVKRMLTLCVYFNRSLSLHFSEQCRYKLNPPTK